MRITKIDRQKRRTHRYNIFVDGRFSCGAGETTLLKFNLHSGDEVDEHKLAQVKAADSMDEAKRVALNYISFRPRSAFEVATHLVKKGYARPEATDIARHFETVGLVNDGQFARMFVRDKLRKKASGKALLEQELRKKGIRKELAEEVLDELLSSESQGKAAAELVQRRLKLSSSRLSKLDPLKRRQRLFEYLIRRGFSSEIASRAVKNLHVE